MTTVKRLVRAGLLIPATALGALLLAAPAMAASDTTPPSTPTNLRVEGLSFTQVTLGWAPSTDDSGWLEYVAEIVAPGSTQRFSSTEPTKTFNALVQGATYTANVWAVDAARNQSAKIAIRFTVPVDGQAPTAPTNLRATNPESHSGFLEWDAATDNSSNLVYQIFTADQTRVFATTGLRASISDILATCLILPGSTETLTVVARDVGENVSAPSNRLTVTFPS